MPVVIYVSGPYSSDPPTNTVRAILAGEDVERMGGIPLVPHLSHLWDALSPHEWAYWLRIDLALVARCDVVYRLPGDSQGADLEVAEARRLDIPVIESREELALFVAQHKE